MSPSPRNDLILRAMRGERTERTPVWLMRQAGRFDPAYHAIRRDCGLPLEDLFTHAELAAEITRLPLRLGVDAAILFQDILTPLAPMGVKFVFRPGPAPQTPVVSADLRRRLRPIDPAETMPFVGESIRLVLRSLDHRLPLLGFAGSPLTLLAFLIENGSPSADLTPTLAYLRDHPADAHGVLSLLADVTGEYLAYQAEAGVHAVQLFESIGDRLPRSVYEAFALPYQQRALAGVKGRVPTVLFAREVPDVDRLLASKASVISVGTSIDLATLRDRHPTVRGVQGNVDNTLLRDGPVPAIEDAVRACVIDGGGRGHVLNLNHGILKETPFEHVQAFVRAAKSVRHAPAHQPVQSHQPVVA